MSDSLILEKKGVYGNEPHHRHTRTAGRALSVTALTPEWGDRRVTKVSPAAHEPAAEVHEGPVGTLEGIRSLEFRLRSKT